MLAVIAHVYNYTNGIPIPWSIHKQFKFLFLSSEKKADTKVSKDFGQVAFLKCDCDHNMHVWMYDEDAISKHGAVGLKCMFMHKHKMPFLWNILCISQKPDFSQFNLMPNCTSYESPWSPLRVEPKKPAQTPRYRPLVLHKLIAFGWSGLPRLSARLMTSMLHWDNVTEGAKPSRR